MEKFEGTSIYDGIAVGRIRILEKKERQIRRTKIEDVPKELARYETARNQAAEELHALYEKAAIEVGEVNAQIFEAHAMMLEDKEYNDSVVNIIESQKISAEHAVAAAGDNLAQAFRDMEDEYFQARSADVKDISGRIIRILMGEDTKVNIGNEPFILVTKDLTLDETLQMDKSRLLALVTGEGSASSHTAVLASTMNIPAVIGINISAEWNGKTAIVDGHSGILYIDPPAELLEIYLALQRDGQRKRKLLKQLKGKDNISKSGQYIRLYANIGNISDLASVLQNDAGGIGLFRSEFLYLGKDDYPTEDEQFQAYKKVAETMAGKRAIIRTLDIGADKQADYLHMSKEENPAMGCRAIRLCLGRIDIFKTQLRAILRAGAYGKIAVMYPMIISPDELKQCKEILEECKTELQKEGIPFGEVEQGIMIETPAAAVISDILAKEVDFFSIGTNDLTQYTLAVDRQNTKLGALYDVHHEAVLRLIRMVVKNAHKEGIWVGICGELAADTSLTQEFLDMKLDELSVSPSYILPLRKAIRECR